MKKPKTPVTQRHHLIYANEEHRQKEIVETIYRGEHWLLTLLRRRSNISKGFIKDLKFWILINEDKARDLSSVTKQ